MGAPTGANGELYGPCSASRDTDAHVGAARVKRPVPKSCTVNEATFRLNEGNVSIHTLDRLASFARMTVGKRITYEQLTA